MARSLRTSLPLGAVSTWNILTRRPAGKLRSASGPRLDQQIGKKLKDFTDYASKETRGQVHAGGFLHHSIRINPDGTSMAPPQLSNAERKHRITEPDKSIWRGFLRLRDVP